MIPRDYITQWRERAPERIAALEAIGDERAKALEAEKAGELDAESVGERSPGWTVQTAREPRGVNRDMGLSVPRWWDGWQGRPECSNGGASGRLAIDRLGASYQYLTLSDM